MGVTLHVSRRLTTLALAATIVMAGCTDGDEPEVPEVPTPTPTDQPSTPTETTGTPGAEPTAGVPELCSDLIATGRVAQIVETPMPSGVRRIYNDEFLEASGRIGRLTCEYGIKDDDDETSSPTSGASPGDDDAESAVLEIAVSAYTAADVAAGRVGDTVDRASGQVSALDVMGNEGFLLGDDEDVSLVFADDVSTYVLTLVRGFVPEPAEEIVLLSIAEEILGGGADEE